MPCTVYTSLFPFGICCCTTLTAARLKPGSAVSQSDHRIDKTLQNIRIATEAQNTGEITTDINSCCRCNVAAFTLNHAWIVFEADWTAMADGVNVVDEVDEVDEDEPPTMIYPLITVSDLPSSTTAGIYTPLHSQTLTLCYDFNILGCCCCCFFF